MDDGKTKERKRRPFLTSDCNDLNDAELFRRDIIRQISKKVTTIQNAGLGEFRIRDLNDQINRLLREKRHWEERIKELGGSDHSKASGPKFDFEGREVPGNRGYKYFGAAKDLPGVRELFSHAPLPSSRKTRAELMVNIDASYYGYMDEDDGVIIPLERDAEKKAIAEALGLDPETDDIPTQDDGSILRTHTDEDEGFLSFRQFLSHVPSVPSRTDIQDEILRRKKIQMLQTFLPQEEPIMQSRQEAE